MFQMWNKEETFSRVDCWSIKIDLFLEKIWLFVSKLLDWWLIRILYEFSITWFVALLNVFFPFFVSPIIIIPLIRFPSLARPINFLWHLSEWNKWNDWFPSFVQRVRHYMTYVGSLPYLEPIIWWVGRQPTNAEIRVLKSRRAEEHGWRSHPIWLKCAVLVETRRGEVAFNGH